MKARLVFSTMASHNEATKLMHYKRTEYDDCIIEEYLDQYGQKVIRIFNRNQDGSQGSLKSALYHDAAGRYKYQHIHPNGKTDEEYLDIYGKIGDKHVSPRGEVHVTFYIDDTNKKIYIYFLTVKSNSIICFVIFNNLETVCKWISMCDLYWFVVKV